MPRWLFWLVLCAVVAVTRLCHLDIVWVEEGYPLAAARQMLAGKTLYADIWFDKPPLFPLAYMATGGAAGWPLRLMGIGWALLSAWNCAWAARRVWGRPADLWAGGLCAFFLTFDMAPAVMAVTPDFMVIPLHAAALGCAASGMPFAAGIAAGLAVGFNSKALLLIPAALLWQWRKTHHVFAGFILPVLLVGGWLAWTGALEAHWQQVWAWGARYSADTPLATPWLEGARRTLNWAGFHALLFAALAWKRREWRWSAAAAIGIGSAWLGMRFFPRYYFHALPPLALAAGGVLAAMPRRSAVVLSILLAVPLARFGPRYAELGLETWHGQKHAWRDLAMFESSREAARHLKGGRLLVWGYRPELFVLSGLPAGTPFLDSQPLNGVLADRHLSSSKPTCEDVAQANRAKLAKMPQPEWLADGLSPYNPALDPFLIPELKGWLSRYRLVAELPGYRLYRHVP